ncbi:hypothetical protein P4B35_01745 [Pontiellaceae bacterium B12227]|nr:hypothetical protein [Pontiellaceae bacterium B12227]
MKATAKVLTVFSIIMFGASQASAVKLFAVNAFYTGTGGIEQLVVEDSSFPDLMDDFISGKGGFSALSGKDVYSGDIRFFGIPDILRLDVSKLPNDTYQINLSSSLSQLDQTFIAVNKEDLRRQFVDWILVEGDTEALNFLEAVALASTAAISDGNPGATTARMADSSFDLFGFYPRASQDLNMLGYKTGSFFGLDVSTAAIETTTIAGEMEGEFVEVALPLWLHFSGRFSYVGQICLSSTSLEGTEFYGFGADMGLAFRPVLRLGDDRFGWQITPFAGAQAVGSVDGVTAAILYDYGFNNRFEWRLAERCLISWVAQYSKFDNLTLSVDDYDLNTKIDQKIVKNGMLLEAPVGHLKSLYASCFIVDTRFLKESATSSYQTIGLGLGYLFKTFSCRASLGYDFTGEYERLNFNCGLSWDL